MTSFFETKIEFLKGVGPQRAALLQKELNIFTFGDLIQHYPFRYEDRTKFFKIREVNETMPSVQVKGKILRFEMIGGKRAKRLVGYFADESGELELVWFQGIKWTLDKIKPGVEYIVFGKPNRYGRTISIAHPEIDAVTEKAESKSFLQPVYSLTEGLRTRHVDSRLIGKLVVDVLRQAGQHIRETLTTALIKSEGLVAKNEALAQIHQPADHTRLAAAQKRLKFEELFYIQLRLLKLKLVRQEKFKGIVFNDAALVTTFYKEHLPFELTDAQKRVIKEIYADMRAGRQMSRLLQGDVGSGKTIVAFICMLVVIGGGYQCALMAPTEILAQQHYHGLKKYADKMSIPIALLTGSVKKSVRDPLHKALEAGVLKILIGTHALLEEGVRFEKLGLAIIDEQHRFGVAQRSKLWQKNENVYPHVLVMTATPIPRTLAMTLYGDLEISTIDELPKGRKPIKTTHRFDTHRLEINGFLKKQI